jgi:hypothetical protein
MANNVGFLFFGEGPRFEHIPLPDLLVYSSLSLLKEKYPAVHALDKALTEWARKFNLTDSWLLDLSLQTLYRWESNASALQDLHWADRGYETPPVILTSEEARFHFSDPGWLPAHETWRQYEAKIKSNFNHQLEEYKSRTVNLAEGRGFEQQPEVRNPNHFKWLARYQVLGESPSKIADHFNVPDENTIWRAVTKTADQIGRMLRPNKKGRRKKT